MTHRVRSAFGRFFALCAVLAVATSFVAPLATRHLPPGECIRKDGLSSWCYAKLRHAVGDCQATVLSPRVDSNSGGECVLDRLAPQDPAQHDERRLRTTKGAF